MRFPYLTFAILLVLFIQPVTASHQVDYRIPASMTTTVGELTTLQVDIINKGSSAEYYLIKIIATKPNEIQITNPTITTKTLNPGESVSVFTNIQTLTETLNALTIQIYSDNDLSHYVTPVPTVSVASKKLSLPEFGLAGFLQIVAVAAVIYFLIANKAVSITMK